MHYRIQIKLGGKVGDLNMSKRDLADLCEMRPGTAGEWVRGIYESPAFIHAARICEELEIELWDFIVLDKGNNVPPKEGREERIAKKIQEVRENRKKAATEKRKLKDEVIKFQKRKAPMQKTKRGRKQKK